MARRVHSGRSKKQEIREAAQPGEQAHERLDGYYAIIALRARIRPFSRGGAYASPDGRIRKPELLFALGELPQVAGRHLAQTRRRAPGTAVGPHQPGPALLVRP